MTELTNSGPDFGALEVQTWTPTNIHAWLDQIGLGELFERNFKPYEVDGYLLLQVGNGECKG